MSLTLPFNTPASVPLEAHSTVNVSVIGIILNITAVVFQAHDIQQLSQITGISLSGDSIHGSSVGLVQGLDGLSNSSSCLIQNNNNGSVIVTILAKPLYFDDPIPGGCALDFDIAMVPVLLYASGDTFTEVRLANANAPYSRQAGEADCDRSVTSDRFKYELLGYFLGNKEINHFTSHIINFASVSDVEKTGRKIGYFAHVNEPFSIVHYPYPFIVNVIVHDSVTSHSQVYVPLVVPCHHKCGHRIQTFVFVLVGFYGILGVFLAFAGHTFFRLNCFTSGFIFFSGLSGFLVVSLNYAHIYQLSSNESVTYLLCVCVGVIGGFVNLLIWELIRSPLLTVFILCLGSGSIFASVMSYFFFDDWDLLFNERTGHILCWVCIFVVVPAALIYWTKMASHLSYSFIGSTLSVVSLSIYSGCTLQYIFIRAYQRFTIPKYTERSSFLVTFFPGDIALCCLWLLLVTVGSFTQHRTCINRAPFPPPPVHNIFVTISKAITVMYNTIRSFLTSCWRRRYMNNDEESLLANDISNLPES